MTKRQSTLYDDMAYIHAPTKAIKTDELYWRRKWKAATWNLLPTKIAFVLTLQWCDPEYINEVDDAVDIGALDYLPLFRYHRIDPEDLERSKESDSKKRVNIPQQGWVLEPSFN